MTLYTSSNQINQCLIFTLAGTAFLALFGAVYEAFSHGVYSYYMIYAFAIPLIMGVIPYTIMKIKNLYPKALPLKLWNAAIATFATGSVFKGVLDIYGTDNPLVLVYPIAGIVFTLLALFFFFRITAGFRDQVR